MKIYDSATLAFYDTAMAIALAGRKNDARGMSNTEITSMSFVLSDPRNRIVTIPGRPIRNDYNAASVCYNLATRNDVKSICAFNENGRRISDDGESFYGANYGQRWDGYIQEAIALLKEDSDTRRAFVPIWHPNDLLNNEAENPFYKHYSANGKDVPCTIGFGLRIIDDALVMQSIMRSQSVLGVMCYDLYLLTVMQELIANELGVELGWYEHHMMSAHFYNNERDLKFVKEMSLNATPEEPAPMRPIKHNFTSATAIYPMAYNLALAGAVDEFTDEMVADPVLNYLLPHALTV